MGGVFSGEMGAFVENRGGMGKNGGFNGKIGIFLKNGVFLGFWSRMQGK